MARVNRVFVNDVTPLLLSEHVDHRICFVPNTPQHHFDNLVIKFTRDIENIKSGGRLLIADGEYQVSRKSLAVVMERWCLDTSIPSACSS